MFDGRLYVPLFVVFLGALAAQNSSREQEEQVVTSIPTIVTTGASPSSGKEPVTSPRTSDMETSTKSPRHHHSHHSEWDMHITSLESGTGDWDYIGELAEASPRLSKVLQEELGRHLQDDPRASTPTRLPPRPPTHRAAGHAHGRHGHAHDHDNEHDHTHAHPRTRASHMLRMASPSLFWVDFCKEAAEEDEEPFRVSDGSFHPRFEEVPGMGVYRLHAHPRAWEEARQVCEREGAQLAVPNSRVEALALTEIHNRCPRLLPTHFNDYQYLGAHDLYSEGNWETIAGHPLNETGYVVWGRNQPDDAHHDGENCLSMNRNGFFNDVPCWTELPFICEHP